MSEGRAGPSRGLCALATAALVAVPSAPGRGQTPAELRQRIARLTVSFDAAELAAARADSLIRARVPFDTVRSGAFRILVGRSMVPLVTVAADSAWRVLERTFGRAAGAVAAQPLVIQVQGQVNVPASGDWRTSLSFLRQVQAGDIARSLVANGAQTIGERQDSALSAWLLASFIPTANGSDRFYSIYLELVTSPWSTAHSCYLGDLAACRAALGVTGRADPILGWYDALDRRRMVREFEYPFWKRSAGVLYDRCAQGGPDASCEAALRAIPPIGITTPLSTAARISLLEAALDAGGPGAYERLLAAPRRPIESRLAAAAAVPGDSLFALWRARVLAARPKTVGLGGRSAWAAVLWGTVLGMLALRSTRWR